MSFYNILSLIGLTSGDFSQKLDQITFFINGKNFLIRSFITPFRTWRNLSATHYFLLVIVILCWSVENWFKVFFWPGKWKTRSIENRLLLFWRYLNKIFTCWFLFKVSSNDVFSYSVLNPEVIWYLVYPK